VDTLTQTVSTNRKLAAADILAVIAVSVLCYAAELAAAGLVPWGQETRGVPAVLGGAAAAIWLTLKRGRTMAELGLRRPKRWLTVPFWAIGILVVFVVAQILAPVLVAPIFDLPEPDLSRYDIIRGNLPVAVAAALLLPLTASIPEEVIYRGFLIERLEPLFAGSRLTTLFAVLAQSLLFGLVHFQWGAGGIIVATIMGLVWGTAFILCGRNLWIVIIAHSMGHVALVTQLYLSPPPG
jgi:membrane protease YdiL (CAAX protease family)